MQHSSSQLFFVSCTCQPTPPARFGAHSKVGFLTIRTISALNLVHMLPVGDPRPKYEPPDKRL